MSCDRRSNRSTPASCSVGPASADWSLPTQQGTREIRTAEDLIREMGMQPIPGRRSLVRAGPTHAGTLLDHGAPHRDRADGFSAAQFSRSTRGWQVARRRARRPPAPASRGRGVLNLRLKRARSSCAAALAGARCPDGPVVPGRLLVLTGLPDKAPSATPTNSRRPSRLRQEIRALTRETAPPDGTRVTALVTGASGGLGSAIAAALAHANHDVAVHWRSDRAGAEATAAAVRATGRVAIWSSDLAVTEAAHLDHLIADLLRRRDDHAFGASRRRRRQRLAPGRHRLGRPRHRGLGRDAETWRPAAWQALIARGPLSMTHDGVIVTIGSIEGFRAASGHSSYAASKAALHHPHRGRGEH